MTTDAPEPQLTPMMAQYRRVKSELPKDALLLFRLGDFYEMFFDDAIAGAQLLNVALTKRGTVPMCGIPHHAFNSYVARILRAGRKVAVCDQVEEARPGQLVKREVTQILSPGTHFDERLLAAERNNFLAAVYPAGKTTGIAVVDLTTGDFRTTETESDAELLTELERLRPDCVLVEGPPDADALIPLAAHAEMAPPVALLLYLPDAPQHAVYYPFAEFSPEWQAIQYALKHQIPGRFMDLAQANQLPAEDQSAISDEQSSHPPLAIFDPFATIAEAAGYSDGERWWEHFVEQRREAGDVFLGILELMGALRTEEEQHPGPDHAHNLLREAAMRTIIRQAQAEGHQNIAIICGAWHAPALAQPGDEKADTELMKVLPKQNVAATWVPWTYDRLSRRSGYGAGIDSPGWYEHFWQTESHIVETWMVKVAQLMRQEDLGISPAHAIEATRLAETLAALRERPLPGLPELDESVQSVFCGGDDTPMRLIREKLIIGIRMGSIPPEAPTVPLQRDLAALQKRTRLEPSA
ncbi:MAG: hypothetical protein HZA89_13240, partial [Verrucomicrobia bacterium]|nr:hypothetical protein [Verrucomicrobiota bacterium]